MRDLTDELVAIRQMADNLYEWSVRELIGVVRPGRIIWSRVEESLRRASHQAKLQKVAEIDRHFVLVKITEVGKNEQIDCKLSGYGAYLFLGELKPSEAVRAAIAYFSQYAAPTIPAPIDSSAVPLVELPSISLRSRLNAAVRAYATKYALDFDFAWNQVYTQHKYRYKIDIKQRAKNVGKATLTWAEENSKLQELLAIANYLIEPKPYSLGVPSLDELMKEVI
jgi:hypothetical protein